MSDGGCVKRVSKFKMKDHLFSLVLFELALIIIRNDFKDFKKKVQHSIMIHLNWFLGPTTFSL
jgi:hypothetical protein